jgi:hypothetical protein
LNLAGPASEFPAKAIRISHDLQLFDNVAELLNLRLFGVLQEHVLRTGGCVRGVHIAEEGTLRGVEIAA